MDTLITVIVILSEILAAVLIGGLFLFLHMRKKMRPAPAEISAEPPQDTMSPRQAQLQYLALEIERSRQKIAKLSNPGLDQLKTPIQHRLDFLQSEKRFLEQLGNDEDSDNFWSLVASHFQAGGNEPIVPTTPEYDKLEKILNIYRTRVDNLETFKKLFFDSQEELSEKSGLLARLSQLFCEGLTATSQDDIDRLIEILQQEKDEIMAQLDIDDEGFNEIVTGLQSLRDQQLDDTDTSQEQVAELMAKIRSVEEENGFLVEQIEHLLKTEVENSKKMLDRMHELEDQVDKKEKEIKKLKRISA